MKLIREGGYIHKSDTGYEVQIDYHNEDEFEPESGFTSARFDMIIPLEVGSTMTVDDLYAEAFRRIDLIKGLV